MAADLIYKLTGGASQADPDLSLGGTGSSVTLSSTALNNLFDNVTPPELVGSAYTNYRAIDIYNDGDAEARNVEFYLTDTPNAESIIAIWYESSPGQSIVDEDTEPLGATWTTPLVGSKQATAEIAAAGRARIWVRRIVDQDADNLNQDTAILHVWFS